MPGPSSSLGSLRIDIGASLASLESDLAKATQRLDRWASGVGDRLKATGKVLTAGLTVPLAAAAAASIAAADRIGKAQRDLAATSGKTGQALGGLVDDFRSVARGADESFGDIAAVVGRMSRATGASGQDLRDLANTVLAVADLYGEQVIPMTEGVAAALKAWKVPARDAADATAIVAAAAQRAGQTATSMATALADVAAVARPMGLGMAQAADLMARMGAAGIDAEPVMKGLGKAMTEMAQRGVRDIPSALLTIQDAIKNAASEADALAIAADFFGDRAATKMVQAIRDGALALDELGVAFQTSGADLRQFADNNKTLGERWGEFVNNVALSAQPLGTVLIDLLNDAQPVIQAVMDHLARMAAAFRALDPATKRIVVIGAAALALVGPITSLVGGLVGSIGTLVGGLGKTASVVGTIAGFLPTILAGIAAIGTAVLAFEFGRWLYERFAVVQKGAAYLIAFLQTGWVQIKAGFQSMTAVIVWAWEHAIYKAKGAFGEWLQDTADGLEAIGSILPESLDVLTPAAAKIKALVAGTVQPRSIVDRLVEIKEGTDKEMGEVAEILRVTLEQIDREFADPDRPTRSFWQLLADDAGVAVDTVKGLMDPMVDKIRDAMGRARDVLMGVKVEADDATGAIEGIGQSGNQMAQAVTGAGTRGKYAIQDLRNQVRGLTVDLQKAFEDDLTRTVQSWGKRAADTFADLAVSGKASFRDLAQSAIKELVSIFSQRFVFGPLANVLSGAFSTFAQGLGGSVPQPGQPGFVGPIQAAAHGGVRRFAQGDVLRSPRTFPMTEGTLGMAGEAGPEAFFPLTRRGGNLGLTGTAPEVTIQVIDQRGRGAPITTRETSGPDGTRQVQIMVEDAVDRGLGRGRFDKTMGRRFGAPRVPDRR